MRLSCVAAAFLFSAPVLLASGCSNGSVSEIPNPARMTPLHVAGNYSGTNTDSVLGDGTVSANIVQAGRSLSGLWTVTYPGNPNAATSFTGMINGTAIALTIAATSFSPCSYSLTGIVSGKQIWRSYTSSNCPNSGSFSITRP